MKKHLVKFTLRFLCETRVALKNSTGMGILTSVASLSLRILVLINLRKLTSSPFWFKAKTSEAKFVKLILQKFKHYQQLEDQQVMLLCQCRCIWLTVMTL